MASGADRQETLQRICHEFGVAILYVFGSRGVQVRDWLNGALAQEEARTRQKLAGYRRWVKQHPDKMEQA